MSDKKTKYSAAILLCGHGSRSPEAADEFNSLVTAIQNRLPDQRITGAFLEFNQPTILDGLLEIYDQGIRQITVQPLTLYNAGHTTRDIPNMLADFSKNHPDVNIRYGSSLRLGDAVIMAAASAIQSVMPEGDPEDIKLLVVGRGSKDRLISDQTINLCRKLHNQLDFGDSIYCYASDGTPLLKSALKQAAYSHYPQVVILPYLLFSGRLLSEIHREIDLAAQAYPDFTFIMAPHLASQDQIITAIIENLENL